MSTAGTRNGLWNDPRFDDIIGERNRLSHSSLHGRLPAFRPLTLSALPGTFCCGCGWGDEGNRAFNIELGEASCAVFGPSTEGEKAL